MSNATTPADPTGQIATVAAVLSPETPIVPTSGTKRVPDDSKAAVVQDAQRYDWRTDMDVIESCDDMSECADGCCTYFTPRHNDECIRLAAYIERLEAEYPCRGVMDCARCEHHIPPVECEVLVINARHKAERDVLLAEHEVIEEAYGIETADDECDCLSCRITRAHDNAERVIRGE